MHNHAVIHIRDEQKKLKSFEEAGKDRWACYNQIYNGVNIKEKPCPSYENHVLGGLCYVRYVCYIHILPISTLGVSNNL